MKIKKILASIIAGTLAVSSMALAAGAEEVKKTLISSSGVSYVFEGVSTDSVTVSGATITYDNASAGTSAATGVDYTKSSASFDGKYTYSITINVGDVKVNDATAVKLNVANGKTVKDVRIKLDDNNKSVILAYKSTNTAAAGLTANINSAVTKNSEKRQLAAAGKAKITATFTDAKKDAKIKIKLGGDEKEYTLSGTTWTTDVGWVAEDNEFDYGTIEFSSDVAASDLLSVVLSWDDSATATATTPAGGGDDISKEPEGSGSGDEPDNNSNPGTGVMVAVIPAIVSAAAAVVSKKKR